MNKKTKRKINLKPVVSLIMIVFCFVSIMYFLYSISLLNGIETFVRIVLSLIIIIFGILLALGFVNSIKNKNNKYIVWSILSVIYSFLLIFAGAYVIKTYNVVSNFSSDETIYSSSIVVLKENKISNIDKIKMIGLLNDTENIVGNNIPNEVIEEKELNVSIKEYDSYIDLIAALYSEEIDAAFLPTNYAIMFSNYEGDKFDSLEEKTEIIFTQEKSVKSKQESKTNSLTQPFTILLMGVDSQGENIAGSAFNGDSLMLITFNPNTLSSTILSIPRDSYVPITCFPGQARSKITHAAWYGESCMINTIENFTGVTIDYYVKINFKGVVKIVDTLGGIEVDVPYSFCEQNSDRLFGEHTLYITKGFQTLNGEQALAFSRNRHTWPSICGPDFSNYVSNDFIRGQNQQTVLKAILNKIKEKGDLQTIYNLLDVVSNSMETNMTTNEILSLYNIAKDVISKSLKSANITDVIEMKRLYLSGKDAYIYEPSMDLNLYNYVLYNESVAEVSKAMKINLGIEEADVIKEFSFAIDEEYEQIVPGMMSSGTTVSYSAKKPTKQEDSAMEDETINDDKDETSKENVESSDDGEQEESKEPEPEIENDESDEEENGDSIIEEIPGIDLPVQEESEE